MSLRDAIARVEGREKTLTVYDPSGGRIADEVREYFASQQLRIEVGSADGRPGGFAVLSDDGTVLTAVDAATLLAELDGRRSGREALGELLGYLDETTFSSYDVDQMLAATREMEDRAWRHGRGRLHAGFQRHGALERQADVYADLATRDLDVHVYVVAEGTTVDVGNATVHCEEADEIADTWFVVFDGDGDPERQCALLAQERGDREFYGVWTYDSDLVGEVLDYLEHRYLGTGPRTGDGRS